MFFKKDEKDIAKLDLKNKTRKLQLYAVYTNPFIYKNIHRLKVKEKKKIYHAKSLSIRNVVARRAVQ